MLDCNIIETPTYTDTPSGTPGVPLTQAHPPGMTPCAPARVPRMPRGPPHTPPRRRLPACHLHVARRTFSEGSDTTPGSSASATMYFSSALVPLQHAAPISDTAHASAAPWLRKGALLARRLQTIRTPRCTHAKLRAYTYMHWGERERGGERGGERMVLRHRCRGFSRCFVGLTPRRERHSP